MDMVVGAEKKKRKESPTPQLAKQTIRLCRSPRASPSRNAAYNKYHPISNYMCKITTIEISKLKIDNSRGGDLPNTLVKETCRKT